MSADKDSQMSADKKPTRDGFGEGLLELGKINKDVIVLSADLTDSTRAAWFKEKFPDRFFCLGVSEQDMFGTAAGLALSGKIPFACTFGVFASGRAWDQIRVSICYMNLNVKIAGSHGGISVGPDGATHQALEEFALMRVLPNMTVVCPSDSIEAKKATIESVSINGPVYLRLGRNPLPLITDKDTPFKIGRAVLLKEGKDVAIIACGSMVFQALEAAKLLEKDGISASILNLHTIKPIDKQAIISLAKKTKAIITVEEHNVLGGMGSAVSEIVAENFPVTVKRMGICDRFGESGEPDELFKFFHLLPDDIADTAKKLIR